MRRTGSSSRVHRRKRRNNPPLHERAFTIYHGGCTQTPSRTRLPRRKAKGHRKRQVPPAHRSDNQITKPWGKQHWSSWRKLPTIPAKRPRTKTSFLFAARIPGEQTPTRKKPVVQLFQRSPTVQQPTRPYGSRQD